MHSQTVTLPLKHQYHALSVRTSFVQYWRKLKLRYKFFWFFSLSVIVPLTFFLIVATNAPVAGSIFLSGLLALSTIVVSVVLTWMFSRRFINTVQSLNVAADRLSIGDLEVVRDSGPNVRCWEILNCNRRECPAYGNEREKCWYVDNTLCTGTRQERFPDKIADCRHCAVYDLFSGDELANLAGSINNAIHRLRHSARERERMQKQMLHHERLSSIGETITGIAHSIKNMLGMIKGGTYLVESGLAQERKERVLEGWDMVKKGNQYISDLVIKMLTLCREHVPNYEEIELAELVDAVVAVAQPKADDRNVRLTVALDSSMPRAIVDAACLREALINLTDNAIDASPDESGVVTIGSARGTNGLFDLYVEDNGPGVPPEMRSQLFTPFFTTKGKQGTGLGLAVTDKIISEHGGEIRVHSGTHGGSRFILRIPVLDRVPISPQESSVSNTVSVNNKESKVVSYAN